MIFYSKPKVCHFPKVLSCSKSISLTTSLQQKDSRQFWKEVQRDLTPATPVPLLFDNILGEVNIAEHWKRHFSAIYQDVTCCSNRENVDLLIANAAEPNNEVEEISFQEMAETLKSMKTGKSPGIDHVAVEHLVNLTPQNLEYLLTDTFQLCASSCLSPYSHDKKLDCSSC